MSSTKRLLFLDMDGVIVDLPEGMSKRWGEVGFWETLSKTPWADELVTICRTHYLTHILSSTGGGPASATGKMLWLTHYYPDLVEGAILTRKKFLLANGERILVDDDPQNIAGFVNWGGVGVLVPNPSKFPDYAKGKSIEEVFEWLVALSS